MTGANGAGEERAERVRAAAVFALVYPYLWLCANPSPLVDDGHWFVPFASGWEYLGSFAYQPGWPTDYVSAFLSQYYRYPWLAALILTVLSWGLYRTTRVFVRLLWPGLPSGLAYLPVWFVLVLAGRYVHQLPLELALLAALAAITLYAALPVRLAAGWRAVAVAVIGGVLYTVAGAAFQLFCLSIGVLEIRRREAYAVGLVSLAAALLVPWVLGVGWFTVTPKVAYTRLLATDSEAMPAGFEAVLLLQVLYVALAAACGLRLDQRLGDRFGGLAQRRSWRWLQARPRLVFAAAVAVSAVGLHLAATPQLGWLLRLRALSRQGRWGELLVEARVPPGGRYDLAASYFVNQALHHEGALLDAMFTFPQSPGTLAFAVPVCTGAPGTLFTARKDLYYFIEDLELDMGLVNDVAHEAHEALAMSGEQPLTLRRLALCYAAKDMPEAARVFLRAMGCSPAYAAEARSLEATMDRLAAGAAGNRIERIRACQLREEPNAPRPDLETNCRLLLAANPRNRMAFEYLMAVYLLNRQPERLADHAGDFAALGYAELPTHCQEALAIHEAKTGVALQTAGLAISTVTRQRLADFEGRVMPLATKGDTVGAAGAAAGTYGCSFFYYFSFGRSGVFAP